jgi:hypothetical protein
MRKIIFILYIILLSSCSNESQDEVANLGNKQFNPPTWIQGTWYHYPFNNTDYGVETTYRFLPNNILVYNGEPNNSTTITDYNLTYGSTTFTEEYFPNKYLITITFSSVGVGSTVIARQYFFKINETTFKLNDEDDINSAQSIFYKID